MLAHILDEVLDIEAGADIAKYIEKAKQYFTGINHVDILLWKYIHIRLYCYERLRLEKIAAEGFKGTAEIFKEKERKIELSGTEAEKEIDKIILRFFSLKVAHFIIEEIIKNFPSPSIEWENKSLTSFTSNCMNYFDTANQSLQEDDFEFNILFSLLYFFAIKNPKLQLSWGQVFQKCKKFKSRRQGALKLLKSHGWEGKLRKRTKNFLKLLKVKRGVEATNLIEELNQVRGLI